MNARSVFYVDDENENLTTLSRLLRGKYALRTHADPSVALELLRAEPVDVLISDQRMPSMAGTEFIRLALAQGGARLAILLTAYSDMEVLVEAVNGGLLFRYIPKPLREMDLFHALDEAFAKIALQRENEDLLRRLESANLFLREEIREGFAGDLLAKPSAGLRAAADLARKVAPTASSVLIRGESGVGKEMFARAIHEASPRAGKPFIRVNCGSLAESLLESELFGHEKGAFTGSAARRIGKFEAAHQGTVFLDEIGDISPKLQVNLLRVLQEREFERVGGNETVRVDIRVIAATHRKLERMIEDGSFREDLYFRLNVFPIHVPPLRERAADIAGLCDALIAKAARRVGVPAAKLSAAAAARLKAYDWPGNVRELENVLERALILATTGEIAEEDVVLDAGGAERPETPATEITRESLQAALTEAGGNKVEAARRLGIKRPTLYYHLKRLGID